MLHLTGTIKVAYGDVPGIDGAAALTIAWWWIPGTFTSDGHGIMGKGSVQPFRVILHPVTGKLCFEGANVIPYTGAVFTSGVLHHAAIVYDGSQSGTAKIKFFKNAVETAKESDPAGATATLADGGSTVLTVGWEAQNNTIGPNDFANLRIWAAALTPAELAQEMPRHRPARLANLLLDCPFDDGILCKDYSPLRNAETVTGTPTRVQGPPVAFGAPVLVL